MISKKAYGFVAGIELYGGSDVSLHRVRFAIVTDGAKGLVRPEQAVGSRERLNDVFILQQLVEVERVHPFRVEAGQHLIHHDQQIELFVWFCLNADVLLFMRKAQHEILLEFRVRAEVELLPVACVVVFQDFDEAFRFKDGISAAVCIDDMRIEKRGDFQLRALRLHQAVVGDGFRDAARGKNGVEFTALAQGDPVVGNVLNHCVMVFVTAVLGVGQMVFDAGLIDAGAIPVSRHRHIVHVTIENILFLGVSKGFLRRCSFGFLKRDGLTQIAVAIGEHLVGIKAEHVLVADAVGDAVAVQLIAEDIGRGVVLADVLLVDGCAAETEEDRAGKALFDINKHVAKGGAVALINDEHDTLGAHSFEIVRFQPVLLILESAHLLDRTHNERIGGIAALEFLHQHTRVFRGLHLVDVSGEVAVVLQRLCTKLDAVEQENHLVCIFGIGDELGRLEARHRLARSGGVPDVAAETVRVFPIRLRHFVGNGVSGVILITAHHFQHAVRLIRHRVKANELVCHRDGKQAGGEALPIVDWLVVEVRPVEGVVFVEFSIRPGIGEVKRLGWLHRYEDLNERKEAAENPLTRILLDLVVGLAHRHAALLQLDVDHRHAINEQQEVAAPIIKKRRATGVARLLHDLVAALPGGNLVAVVDLQAHFLAKVQPLRWIVAGDGDGFAIDEAIKLERRAQRGDLLHNLLHLAVSQRYLIESIDPAIVLKQDLLPVRKQVRLGRILDDFCIAPTALAQLVDHGVFKFGFFGKGGHG